MVTKERKKIMSTQNSLGSGVIVTPNGERMTAAVSLVLTLDEDPRGRKGRNLFNTITIAGLDANEVDEVINPGDQPRGQQPQVVYLVEEILEFGGKLLDYLTARENNRGTTTGGGGGAGGTGGGQEPCRPISIKAGGVDITVGCSQ
jgi:hypothetical protein